MTTASAVCAGCGSAIAVDAPRAPCSRCGATRRHYSVSVADKVTFYDGVRMKLKRPSLRGVGKNRKGVAVESRNELQPRGDNGKLVRVQQTVDRVARWYDKIVSDPKTGEILYECHEPLEEHQGRGSASPGARRRRGEG